MIIDSRDPWGHFLHARKLVIDQLLEEGQTVGEIANTLSMDSGQVTLIAMTPIHLDIIGAKHSVREHLRPGRTIEQLRAKSGAASSESWRADIDAIKQKI